LSGLEPIGGSCVAAIAVVLVIVGVVAVLAVRTGSSALTEDPDPPRSSVSGWDDSSPIPTADPYYPGVVSQTELHSKPVTIDGVSGWSVRTEVKIDDPAADGLDDLITVVVLDTGPDGAWSFFVGDVPPRDKARLRLLDDTIAGIRVD
jgi:hypothetical protein